MKEFIIAFIICLVSTCWVGGQDFAPVNVGVSVMGGGSNTTPDGTEPGVPVPEINYVDDQRKAVYPTTVGEKGYFGEARFNNF